MESSKLMEQGREGWEGDWDRIGWDGISFEPLPQGLTARDSGVPSTESLCA